MGDASREILRHARQQVPEWTPTQVQAQLARQKETESSQQDIVLVDVREKHEWNEGHIPGALHVPKGFLELQIEEAVPDKSKKVVLYCAGGVRSLIAGSTLYIPVFVRGALFEIGDGHGAQGDGEVDQTALETSLRGRVQLTVRKGQKLLWPRAETSTDFISMASDEDLKVATTIAIQEMVDFLADTKNLTKHEAYQLVSVAGNVAITQLVDRPVYGVHVKMPKNIFE